jgi:hypothetical protein
MIYRMRLGSISFISALEIVEPQRKLYLALGKAAYDELNAMETFRMVVRRFVIALIIMELLTEKIVQWTE